MKAFNFTDILDRTGKDAIAIDPEAASFAKFPPVKEGFSRIPMWVADMNFPTAPSITEAIIERAGHPAFGYFAPKDDYFDAIIGWQKNRNGVDGLTREAIGYENGVLGGVVSAMKAAASPGDKVLVHSPTYIGFTHALEDAGYRIVLSELKQDAEGIFRMDFDDMEAKLKEHRIHAAVFCSPHNPTGRVWTEDELNDAMALFKKYDVTVISDEIWSDLLLEGQKHIPTQSVSDDAKNRTVALYAPSKTFNLAGLVGSYHVIYNKTLRDRVRANSAKTCYNGMNVLSMHALIGAYSETGAAWLDALREVLTRNVTIACDYFNEKPGIAVAKPQGTYMIFPDFAAWCEARRTDVGAVLKAGQEVGVLWQDGRPFHGKTHIRLNLALPESLMREAFDRLDQYVLT